ncbi:chromatin modification-related protein EAF1 A-like isoform X2 [Wolffia australiana]
MGGMVDVGLGVDTKNSPRRVAIEKVQAELRQEYFVREERKRELEFLEKGGNPLDFKFGSASSVSVQSTSVTDHHLDLDAKGSSAVATSTHGDSEDSCIRPGSFLGKDSTTGDNILLMDTQNDNLDEGKNGIRPSKRKPISSAEHPSKREMGNVKESDESGSFRFGVKSQAYARRNRSRPNRESAHIASTRTLVCTSNNSKLTLIPSSSVDSRDKKETAVEIHGDENAVSLVSNSRPGSPCDNVVSRALGEGDVVQGENDGSAVEVEKAGGCMTEVMGKGSSDQKTKESEENSDPSLDFTAKESVLAHADSDLCLPVDNVDKPGSASSNGNQHLDGQTVEEGSALLDIKRKTSSPPADHVSCESIKGSPFPAKKLSVVEKMDAEAVEVKPFDNRECTMIVDEELVSSNHQVKNEETCDASFSLGTELHEAIKVKEKELENPSDDLQVISKPSGPAQVCSSSATSDGMIIPENKSSEKTEEDAILKEARIIEAKMRRANELSCSSFQSDKRKKSHWDYLLEEMAWLANDFIQERSWKIAAASQISRGVARAACLSYAKSGEQKRNAHSLAKAVMSFWVLAEGLHTGRLSIIDMNKEMEATFFVSMKNNKQESALKQDARHLEDECARRCAQVPVLDYAVRFLDCNGAGDRQVIAEAPVTPERTGDSGVLGMTWDDQLSEETLFYVIPAGAMKVYRESIEPRWTQFEDTSYTLHREGFEASTCDSHADYGSHENLFDDDEAETSAHYLSGPFERSKLSKFSLKKKKFFQDKNHNARSFGGRSDLFSGSHIENKSSAQPSLLLGKRVSGAFSGSSIPTKRIRTASRQRVISPFGSGNSSLPVNCKNEVSSGDTSSFQDDQASLHDESTTRRNADFESTADFERRLVFNGSEMPIRSKKKKKQRHMGYRNLNSPDGFGFSKVSSYDQRWQAEPTAQSDQDNLKKRGDGHHFESFGSPGVIGQHAAKKPKLLKQLSDASPDMIHPSSHASPAASQFSSMPTTNKLIKLITSRDRSKKGKGLKMIGGLVGTGGSWTQFEDQALVVLVHDMGTNWELVSDTINSTLQFKCIFRKPIECKERHKVLMERSAGDGADSAEDSGSSQSYPSTLPGIPKGSARQLFQRLQGPMEEDTLKSHFEKIISVGRQLHFRRNQAKSDSKEMKLITQVHSSHIHALTQACPSSLTGAPLTPLDLAEVTQSSETPVHGGYQSVHPSVPPMPTHPSALASPAMGPSGGNSILPASVGLGMSGSLSTPLAQPIGTPRDPRYSSPRPSFPVDEQQRMQQYSQMMASRAMAQQPGMSSPGSLAIGIDRGVRMISGGNSAGMLCGMNNGVQVPARPGLAGIGSPGMVNVVTSGAMLPVNSHPNAVPGQGNSLSRPRDHLQQVQRPQNAEDHKQIMMQDVQLPSPQPVGSMGSITVPFSNSQGSATAGPGTSIPSFSSPQPPHLFGGNTHHLPHQMPGQHPTYAMRYAKERQQPLQQRIIHQPPHFPTTNSGSNHPHQMQQMQPQSHQPTPGSPAQHARPQNTARTSTATMPATGSGGMPNQRQRPHPQHHPQTIPQRHHLQQQQQRLQNERVFSGGAASGQQKMYTRPPPPLRLPGSSAASHQEGSAQPSPLHHPSQQQQQQQRQQPGQQAMHRMVLQQNNSLMGPPESSVPGEQAHVNPITGMGIDVSGAANSASASPASGSGGHWRTDPAYETPTLSASQKPASSVGVETGGQMLTKRQFSSLPGNVNAGGPQWQQQKQSLQQQSAPDQPPTQVQQLRPPLQSGSFGLPSKPS